MENFKLSLYVFTALVLMSSSPRIQACGGPAEVMFNKSCPSCGNPPFLLVDGIERDPDFVNINNIGALSIISDASARDLYGERASGGVILITTEKNATGPLSLDSGGSAVTYFLRNILTSNCENPPLLLVDGIERDPDFVGLENISALSVLRDAATTALYGERGSGGVIHVITDQNQPDPSVAGTTTLQ